MFSVIGTVVTVIVFGVALCLGEGISSTCSAQNDDPNQCVRVQRTQKCYVINNVTKCDVTTISCITICCAGWTTDINGKCTIPIKNYVCHEPHLTANISDKGYPCQYVTDCHGDHVCCSNQCTGPVYHDHCWYDNIYNTVGETNTTTNDACMSCTCKTDIHTAHMSCEKTRCNWDNQTDIPHNYRPPIIHGLPENGKKIPVYIEADRNFAYLFASIYVTDFGGAVTPKHLSKTTFSHCLCPNSSDYVIVKSVPDMFGNFAEKSFEVDIIDKHPPVFHNCPHDVTQQTGTQSSWHDPTVTDNVGVRLIEQTSLPRGKNNKLISGNYSMVYRAFDWSNNTATCSFRVTILAPPETRHHEVKRNGFNFYVLLACCIFGGVAVVGLLVAVIVLLTRNSRKSHSLQCHQKQSGIFKSMQSNRYGTLESAQQVTE